MNKRALITGINGMDGSHLADLLLEKGYEVFGMERRSSSKNRSNTQHLEGNISFVNGDLTDQNSLMRVLKDCSPNEIYNLGAQSFVGESWNTPEHTSNVTELGVLRMLEAIRDYYYETGIKIGMKPAGGISTSKEALQYLVMVKETLGDDWLTPHLFRFGASSLLTDVTLQIAKMEDGNYQNADYVPLG